MVADSALENGFMCKAHCCMQKLAALLLCYLLSDIETLLQRSLAQCTRPILGSVKNKTSV